jgi:hypothetical protein
LNKNALQTEVNPATCQEHVIDLPANNSIHGGSHASKEDNELSSMDKGGDYHNGSIEPPQVNSLNNSNLHRARTGRVTKDKRRVSGQRRTHARSQDKHC